MLNLRIIWFWFLVLGSGYLKVKVRSPLLEELFNYCVTGIDGEDGLFHFSPFFLAVQVMNGQVLVIL